MQGRSFIVCILSCGRLGRFFVRFFVGRCADFDLGVVFEGVGAGGDHHIGGGDAGEDLCGLGGDDAEGDRALVGAAVGGDHHDVARGGRVGRGGGGLEGFGGDEEGVGGGAAGDGSANGGSGFEGGFGIFDAEPY